MNRRNSAGEASEVALIFDMKMLIAVLFAAGLAHAGEVRPVPPKNKPVTVTGSNISRPAKRLSNTYDTPLAIRVIDQKQIEQSGARTLGQLLRREPGISVR